MANWQNKDGIVTTCDKASDPKEQEKCEHYKKAKYFDRCRYLRDNDMCDYVGE